VVGGEGGTKRWVCTYRIEHGASHRSRWLCGKGKGRKREGRGVCKERAGGERSGQRTPGTHTQKAIFTMEPSHLTPSTPRV
jgi:hypothetical protein